MAVSSSATKLLDRFSSLDKIVRIVAYYLRVQNVKNPEQHTITVLNADGIHHALSALIFSVQQSVYQDEIVLLTKHLPCSKPRRKLDLFIDHAGFLRVNGRLQKADLPYD